jgi:hypothetical protein
MQAPNFSDRSRFEREDDVVLEDDVIDGVSRPTVAVYLERASGHVYQVFRDDWFRKGSHPRIDPGRQDWDEWVRVQ